MSNLTWKQLLAVLGLCCCSPWAGCGEEDCDSGDMECEEICIENAGVCESNCANDHGICSKACCKRPTAEIVDTPTTYCECIHWCVSGWYNEHFPSDDACFEACAGDHSPDAGVVGETVGCIDGCKQETTDCNQVCESDTLKCNSGCENGECPDYVDPWWDN
ncbi:MAG: hypothetical protein GY854_26545 [Deltaproteobacteria bacterium]|nr:hypothetical protein [Deltaproteobacteria bacterium]